MKKNLLLLCLIFISKLSFCQDIITFKTGDEKTIKVLEVGQSEIKYKKDDSSTVLYTVAKTDVFMIKYKDGSKDVFSVQKKTTEVSDKIDGSFYNSCFKAQSDVKNDYKPSPMVGIGSFLTTVFTSGLLGLIPTISCASTTPPISNLEINEKKAKDENYVKCYLKAARKRKAAAAWTGWGIGMGVNFIVGFLYYNSTHR